MTDESKNILATLEEMLCKAEEKHRHLKDVACSAAEEVLMTQADLQSAVRQCNIASEAVTTASLEAEALAEAVSSYRSMLGTKWVDDGFHHPPPEAQDRDVL